MRDPERVRRKIDRLRAETDDLPPGERDEVFRKIAALFRDLKRVEGP